MEETDEAAPRPWRVCGRAEGTKYGESYIVDAAGKCLTTSDGCFHRPDDSELIVRAVNAHDVLVAALRGFLGFVAGGYAVSQPYESTLHEHARQGRAALKLAEGREG